MINTPLSSAHHSFSANAQSELWLECTPATSSCCTGKQALEKSPGCTNMTYTLFLPLSFICIAYHLSVQAMEQGAGLQDCSTSEIKLLDLLSHCVCWKLYHLKMYHSTSVCEATTAQPSHSLPLLVGAEWLRHGWAAMVGFGEVYCVPTQDDLSDNNTQWLRGVKRLLRSKGYSSETREDIT